MSSDLPQFIAPERLAKEGARLEGRIELQQMTRLTKLLTGRSGAVDVKLAFWRTEDGCACITGNYDTALQLLCQRCLEPVTVRLSHDINVGVTCEGAQQQLPAAMEPLVLTQDSILLADFIEEEILLGLPIAPMHELQDCAAEQSSASHHEIASGPFQVLETLKSG